VKFEHTQCEDDDGVDCRVKNRLARHVFTWLVSETGRCSCVCYSATAFDILSLGKTSAWRSKVCQGRQRQYQSTSY